MQAAGLCQHVSFPLVSTQDGAGHPHTTEVNDLGELDAAVPALEGTHTVLVRKLAGRGGEVGEGLGAVDVDGGELLQLTATQDGAGHAHTTKVNDLGELNTTIPALEGTHTILVCELAGRCGKVGQALGAVDVDGGELLQLTATQDGAGHPHTTEVNDLGELDAAVPALEGTHTVLVRKLAGRGGEVGEGLGAVDVDGGELLQVTGCRQGATAARQRRKSQPCSMLLNVMQSGRLHQLAQADE